MRYLPPMPALLIPNLRDDIFALLVEHAKKDGVSAAEEAARLVEKALPVPPAESKEAPAEPAMSLVDYLMTMPEIEDEYFQRPRRMARGVPQELFDD